jgi:hypothetical protein
MYKDKEKQKEAGRERVRRYREGQKALQKEGVTSPGALHDYPDIIDKLTDPFWRDRLEKICGAFKSRNPHDMQVCWLGDVGLVTVCDWLECTN